MKRIFTVTLLAILLTAQLFGAQVNAQTDDEKCKKVADLAFVIMTGRQGGIPMTNMIDGFTKEPDARAMIIDAYEIPRIQSASVKKIVIEDFRDKWALSCYSE